MSDNRGGGRSNDSIEGHDAIKTVYEKLLHHMANSVLGSAANALDPVGNGHFGSRSLAPDLQDSVSVSERRRVKGNERRKEVE